MFTIISGPISGSISRFLTYDLGKGDLNELRITFSTAINAMLILSGLIIILCEGIGVWFLNCKLNIPAPQIYPANWVLQCSIFSMVLGFVNMPYTAAIISHERMDIYAYLAILDVVLKLALVFFLRITPFNVLITYAFGLMLIYVIDRIIYGRFCVKKYPECHYSFVIDKKKFKHMTSFAWWSFLGNMAYISNTQGTTMLMNVYFGVVVNTAKGIATQVETAVMSFVNTFTTAFTPQITKSFAEGNMEYMYSIMARGTKFSIYLMLFFLIPLEFEADMVLRLWLGSVPEFSSTFLRLSLICTTLLLLGGPYVTGICAHGDIRNYEIVVTIVGILVLPLTWLAYKLEASVVSFYYIFIAIYIILIFIRMFFVQNMLGYKFSNFLTEVLTPITLSSLLSFILPALICSLIPDSVGRLFLITGVSMLSSSVIIYTIGVNKQERAFINGTIRKAISKSKSLNR